MTRTLVVRRGLIPGLVVLAVLAVSFILRPISINTVLAACSYGYLGAPTVTGVNPTAGSTGGGNSVTISGCGFTGATAVHFGATVATFAVTNDSTVAATSPAHAAGVVDVTVTTSHGTSATSVADQFTYTAPCATVTATPTPVSPSHSGKIIHIAAVATGCASPLYEFWKMVPGYPWNIVQPYSARASWNWDTNGPEFAGTYYWSVWVKDANSVAAYDAFQPGQAYTLTSAPCTGVTATALPASPQAQGATVVTITATGTCPDTAQYEFWILAPGGTTWQMVQGYSTGNTFSWSLANINGGYHWSVWVKDSSSPGTTSALGSTFDAYQPGQLFQIT